MSLLSEVEKTKVVKVKYHFTSPNIQLVVENVKKMGFKFVQTYKMEETFYDDEDFSNMKRNIWTKTITTDSDQKKISKKASKVLENNLIQYEEESLIGNAQSKLKPIYSFVVYRSIYHKDNILFTYDLVEYKSLNVEEHMFVVFCLSGNASENDIIEESQKDSAFETCTISRSKIIEIIWRTNRELYSILQSNNVVPKLEYSSIDFDPSIRVTKPSTTKLKKRQPRQANCSKD